MQKKSKFNVNTTEKGKKARSFEGILFASEMELKFYRDVLLPAKDRGEIVKIVLQPVFILQPSFEKFGKKYLPIKYISDFEVEYSSGITKLYDVKGMVSESAKIKKKLFDFTYPTIILEWVTLSQKWGNGWMQYDELIKKRNGAKRKNNALQ
jgi:hypothetical protein